MNRIIRRILRREDGVTIIMVLAFMALAVPVVTESLYSLIEEALLTQRPAIWIGFGWRISNRETRVLRAAANDVQPAKRIAA